MKAIVRTLEEKHKDKNMDEVLDLHGLKSKEAQKVLDIQLPIIEDKLVKGEIKANTPEGHVYCIVTGKGSHGKRPVLRKMVERYLAREGFTYTFLENEAGLKVLFQ